MKKFKITGSYVTYCTLIVNAHNEDEAWAIALDTDGGDFEASKDCSDWQISEVVEIKSQ